MFPTRKKKIAETGEGGIGIIRVEGTNKKKRTKET